MSSLFFILLCFSFMHANSEARYIGFGRSDKGFPAVFPPSDQGQILVVEKLTLVMDSGTTKGSVPVEQDDDLAAEQKAPTYVGAVFSSPTTSKGMKDSSRTSTVTQADVVPDVKPPVTASWSVPQQIKNREKMVNHGGKSSSNPGIYSDYSRPRTRPPSHN